MGASVNNNNTLMKADGHTAEDDLTVSGSETKLMNVAFRSAEGHTAEREPVVTSKERK